MLAPTYECIFPIFSLQVILSSLVGISFFTKDGIIFQYFSLSPFILISFFFPFSLISVNAVNITTISFEGHYDGHRNWLKMLHFNNFLFSHHIVFSKFKFSLSAFLFLFYTYNNQWCKVKFYCLY